MGNEERRHSGFYMKNWHVALLTIVLLATIGASLLYAQKVGNDTAKKVDEAIPRINYLEKCIEVEKEKQEGRYNLQNNKLQNLQDKVNDNNDKLDKVIDLINEKLDGAVIITRPLTNTG